MEETRKIPVYLPDNPSQKYEGRTLTTLEQAKLTQLLDLLGGGSPIMQSWVNSKRADVESVLCYLVETEKKPFAGMRYASGSLGGVVLAPRHIDTNVLDWRVNPATLAAAGWTTRSSGAGVARFSEVTIPDDMWLIILGLEIGYDIKSVAGADYNKKPTDIKYTINGTTTLQQSLYSAGVSGDTNTSIVPIPTQLVSQNSTFTEQLYFPAAINENTYTFYVREVGIAVGMGSVLNTAY